MTKVRLGFCNREDPVQRPRPRRAAQVAVQRHPDRGLRQQALDNARAARQRLGGIRQRLPLGRAPAWPPVQRPPLFANFLDCVRTRKRPNADVEQVHLSTLLCHYGNVAYRVGRKLVIDPATEGFVGNAQASALVKRTYREPYTVPEIA